MKKTDPGIVSCLLCKDNFKYSGSTSSLAKHLRTKHPLQHAELLEQEHISDSQEPQPRGKSSKIENLQPTLRETIYLMTPYKADGSRKRQLDLMVMKMIAQDLQPFSVVEDKGFKRLVSALDPRYELPSRRELVRNHLPSIYNQEVDRVKRELEMINAVSLTTDIWTSRTTKGFITVTAHFISPSWELKTLVLETARMTDAHTSANIADELTKICNKWNILNKVCCIVTDNATNMTSFVTSIMKIRHLPCFAHTLNLAVRSAIKNTEEVQRLQEKVKDIVT